MFCLPFLAAALAGISLAQVRQPELLPTAMRSPVPWFEAGNQRLAACRPPAAAVAYRRGLAQVPWYGPGYAGLGVATGRWIGATAALPYFEAARRFDPVGRTTLTVVTGPLLAAGRISTDQAAQALLQAPSATLAQALPATPPSAWPPRSRRAMSGVLIAALARAQRWPWLSRYESRSVASELDPVARRFTLMAFCRTQPGDACLAAVTACQTQDTMQCPRGVEMNRQLAVVARRQAEATEQWHEAESWAHLALAHGGGASDVRALAKIVARQGRRAEANRILRTHPARER